MSYAEAREKYAALGVDTDAAYINEDLKGKTQNTIGAIHQLIVQAFDVVLLPAVKSARMSLIDESFDRNNTTSNLYNGNASDAFNLQKYKLEIDDMGKTSDYINVELSSEENLKNKKQCKYVKNN